MNTIRLFSDVTTVSNGNRIYLRNQGYLNPDNTVVSWVPLIAALNDLNRKPTQTDAKRLVLIEIQQPSPRDMIINRLLSYITGIDRENLKAKITKYHKKKKL